MKYIIAMMVVLLTGCDQDTSVADEEVKKGAIYLSFDDYHEDWVYILTAYEHDNVEFTFFINGGVGDVVKNLSSAGHSIGNHTRTHINMSTASVDVLEDEILSLNDEISTVSAATSFAFPFGAFTADWEVELLKYFTHMRRFGTKNNEPHFYKDNNIDNIRIIASSSIDNISFDSDAEYYEYVDSIIGHLVLNGGMVSITAHGISFEKWAIPQHRLDYLIRTALDNGIVFKGF